MKQYHLKYGDKYNMLMCICLTHIGKHNRSYFLFRCDCGNTKIILGSLVKSGNTKSCGCLSSILGRNKLLDNNLGMVRQIILGYKRHAKRRNFSWELSEEDVNKMIRQNCSYCNSKPSNIKKSKNPLYDFKYNGIDRINSKIGYSIENCVTCCEQCNRSKMAVEREDFLNWIKSVYEFSIINKI